MHETERAYPRSHILEDRDRPTISRPVRLETRDALENDLKPVFHAMMPRAESTSLSARASRKPTLDDL